MNVLWITWHDLGCHLGCYGRGDVRSPNADALAAQGVRLDSLFATNPICSPARASLLSGLYPNGHGAHGLIHHGWRLAPGVRLAEEYFRDAGWHTSMIGHQHERPNIREFPCDEVWGESNRCAEVAPEVCRRLHNLATLGRPFYLRAGFHEVHRPLLHESDAGWEQVEPLPYLADSEEHRRQLAKYHRLIERADAAMGRILDTLRETGLDRDTLVLFTTDHGVPFPGAKCALYDPGLRITGILRQPGVLPAGRVVKPMVSGVDILPTLLELCGIAADTSHLHGTSLAGLIKGDSTVGRSVVFGQRTAPIIRRSARTERYKYILNFDRLPRYAQFANEELESDLPKTLAPEQRRTVPVEELFDLAADPLEMASVAKDSAHQGALDDIRRALRDWMRRTNDPLLRREGFTPQFEQALALMSP